MFIISVSGDYYWYRSQNANASVVGFRELEQMKVV